MYEFLTGKLIEKSATHVILEVNGVGYRLQTPVSTFSSLPELGQTVRLFTHFVVREDAQMMFGFAAEDERHLFRLLISVSGIGPKTAITVLSGTSLEELKKAIIDSDFAVLTTISGIGRKTAERIVVELRERLVVEDRRVPSSAAITKIQGREALIADCLQALVELGYRKQNAREAIEKAMKQASSEKITVPDLVRASLKFV